MRISSASTRRSQAIQSVPNVVAAPLTLTAALENALTRTRAGQLQWQHRRKPKNTPQNARVASQFKARLGDNALLELTAEYADDEKSPTQLHAWEVRYKQHETDNGRVLDGQRLTLDAAEHAHLIARLFQAVFASLSDGFNHLLPDVEQLYSAFCKGDIPATVTVIPPSLANPMAGSGTVIQVGDIKHDQYPLLEITRFSGHTNLVLRKDGKTIKVPPTALSNDELRTALNTLVDAAFRKQKA